MNSSLFNNIAGYLRPFYNSTEYPALIRQIELFRQRECFRRRRVLDATPVFRNTLAKYMPLIAAGAEVAVAVNDRVPHDSRIVELLESWGVEIVDGRPIDCRFDVIMDCAGVYAGVKTICGAVELTRSGIYHYQNKDIPVFFADGGRIKLIETALGTGDGFVRAMEFSGFNNFKNRKIVIFGCGKVGRGIAVCAAKKGARIIAVDRPDIIPPQGVTMVNMNSPEEINHAIEDAWCVVSVTGKYNAWHGRFNVNKLLESNTLIVNMGVEDEFGPEVPPERVMNNKKPLNFLLDEPTRMRYIEATMALDNAGAEWLIKNPGSNGIILPPEELESQILDVSVKNGEIADEINALGVLV